MWRRKKWRERMRKRKRWREKVWKREMKEKKYRVRGRRWVHRRWRWRWSKGPWVEVEGLTAAPPSLVCSSRG